MYLKINSFAGYFNVNWGKKTILRQNYLLIILIKLMKGKAKMLHV